MTASLTHARRDNRRERYTARMAPSSEAFSGLSVLSAMITPAVLISACGALILSTSNRLGRTTDRVRTMTRRFKELVSTEGQQEALAREEKLMILAQLPKLTRRVRLIQRSLTAFYASVGLFVMTSVVTGGSALIGVDLRVLPVVLAILGAAFLLYASLQLTVEAQLSYQTTREEMRFLEGLGQHYVGLHTPDDNP
ncbi:DUF2721 domain-containing protein [Deinococcus aquiradiocola]|uniref:DUF2721 domain-containing protein n=1 Tax=Deinococcus aquiradiocola TaxID=393059 RepID=A0A917PFJ3_9DEIO|nr:DUF2721 domain-containing protein [Deinococcus aquiradiocola]GGJ73849.1 hypothetical protein GCM10008939_17680 [Deinococcus aquiradiocola]